MGSGFSSWHDIGPLFFYVFGAIFIIIGITVVFARYNNLNGGSRTYVKSMKGGYSKDNLIFFVSMTLIIGAIIYMFASGLNTGGHGVRL
jgi:hypothetical protein